MNKNTLRNAKKRFRQGRLSYSNLLHIEKTFNKELAAILKAETVKAHEEAIDAISSAEDVHEHLHGENCNH